MLHVHTQGKIF